MFSKDHIAYLFTKDNRPLPMHFHFNMLLPFFDAHIWHVISLQVVSCWKLWYFDQTFLRSVSPQCEWSPNVLTCWYLSPCAYDIIFWVLTYHWQSVAEPFVFADHYVHRSAFPLSRKKARDSSGADVAQFSFPHFSPSFSRLLVGIALHRLSPNIVRYTNNPPLHIL